MARKKKADVEVENGQEAVVAETPIDGIPVTDGNSESNGHAEAPAEAAPPLGRRPIASWRYPVDKSTNVQVALWPNQITLQSGEVIEVLSMTIQRSYKDSRTGDWVNARTSFSLRIHELPVLQHAISKAYQFALDQRQQDSPF